MPDVHNLDYQRIPVRCKKKTKERWPIELITQDAYEYRAIRTNNKNDGACQKAAFYNHRGIGKNSLTY